MKAWTIVYNNQQRYCSFKTIKIHRDRNFIQNLNLFLQTTTAFAYQAPHRYQLVIKSEYKNTIKKYWASPFYTNKNDLLSTISPSFVNQLKGTVKSDIQNQKYVQVTSVDCIKQGNWVVNYAFLHELFNSIIVKD